MTLMGSIVGSGGAGGLASEVGGGGSTVPAVALVDRLPPVFALRLWMPARRLHSVNLARRFAFVRCDTHDDAVWWGIFAFVLIVRQY